MKPHEYVVVMAIVWTLGIMLAMHVSSWDVSCDEQCGESFELNLNCSLDPDCDTFYECRCMQGGLVFSGMIILPLLVVTFLIVEELRN